MKIKVLGDNRSFEVMTVDDFVLRMESADISTIQLWSDRILKSFPISISVDGIVYNFLHLDQNRESYGVVAVYQRSKDFDEREISPAEITKMILKYVGKEVNAQNRNSIHYLLSSLRSIQ